MNWTLTDQEADYIFRMLMQRPYQEVAPLLQKLQGQAIAQVTPPPEPPKG